MNLSKLAINRPVASIMLTMVVILVGAVSLFGLPRDLMPKMDFPVALVVCQYPNASPEEVETIITKPLEQALAAVEGLDEIMSMTSQGTSVVLVQFQMSTDMNFATLNMREKIALVSSMLPSEASDPMVIKMDMNATPIMQIYVSGDMPLDELNRTVEESLLSYFERTAGVASVNVYGGVTSEIKVAFDQEKLSGYGLTLSQISQMLAAENINMPSGDILNGSKEIIVRTLGEFQNIEDIKNLPLTLADRSIIRLNDLATVEEGYKDQTSISRVDGKTSVAITITKQSDANTVNVSKAIQKEMEKLKKTNPDMDFVVGFDQADFINSSITSVAQSALFGALLAVIVIFLFLRNLQTTMIIAISIPTSFLATFGLMSLRGMSLNLITLCALTLAVGMLVDNSVVVLENIFRTRQNTDSANEAALKGSNEIVAAVVASTLTSIVVYLPIALSDGISALMFRDFCYTIIIALVASLVVSLTVVPMLASKVMSHGLSTDYIRVGKFHYRFKLLPFFTRFIEWLTDSYESFIRRSLNMKKRIIATCVVLFVLSCSLLAVIGMEFLPSSDEGTFKVDIKMPYGTSLSDKDKLVTELETYIMSIPELKHCTVDIGNTNPMFGGSSDDASLSVTLVSKTEREKSTEQIVKQVKKKVSNISGAEISVKQSSAIMGGMGGDSNASMNLTLKGKELDVLEQISEDLSEIIMEVPNVSEVSTGIEEGNPEVKIKLDRNTAAYYGVSAYQLANGLKTALSGSTSTKLKVAGDEIEVNLSLSDEYGKSVENMKQVMISTPTGQYVSVGQIATFEFDNSPKMINRHNQVRYVDVGITVLGNDLASVTDQILKKVDQYPFPDGYYYETGGQQEQMMEAFGQLVLALVVAILLVYFLLAAQFEALLLPIVVMMATPFAMSGAFFALFIFGKTLSITSFIGLIMLIGIVVNNSILLIEFIRQHKLTMDRDEAIVQAGSRRLRPILMTTVTTCVGMIPMSLGLGEGGEVLAPMGISIIGGLIASTLVTLIMIPVFYALIDDKRLKRIQKHDIKVARIAEQEEKWLKEVAERDRAKTH